MYNKEDERSEHTVHRAPWMPSIESRPSGLKIWIMYTHVMLRCDTVQVMVQYFQVMLYTILSQMAGAIVSHHNVWPWDISYMHTLY